MSDGTAAEVVGHEHVDGEVRARGNLQVDGVGQHRGPRGMRNAGLPFTVSLRTDAGTIAASRSRTAIDAPPMFIAEVPKVFANTTRARAPAIDVWTIWRSVWLFGVIGGGGGAGAFGGGGDRGGGRGSKHRRTCHDGGRPRATQCRRIWPAPNGVAVTNATSAAVARALRMTCMNASSFGESEKDPPYIRIPYEFPSLVPLLPVARIRCPNCVCRQSEHGRVRHR